jgi:hypothetical protein
MVIKIPGIRFISLLLVLSFFKDPPDVPEQMKLSSVFPKPLDMRVFRHSADFGE